MSGPRIFIGQNGEYEVQDLDPFAYGRISVFYRVVDHKRPSTRRELCVKLFRREPRGEAESFTKELGVLKRLSHPNLLPLVDFGRNSATDGAPFLVLPYCEGGNLRSFLEGKDFIPLSKALPLLHQIAFGLDHAHASGVVHGDIKPENILLAEGGSQVYLSDFGVARYFAFNEDIITRSGGSEEGGTLFYLSPEELSGRLHSPRSDIYSFGLIAYELLCGGLPVDRQASIYQQIHAKVIGSLTNPRERNPSLTSNTANALLAALSVDPKQRPATALDLCQYLQDGPPVVPPESVHTPPELPELARDPTSTKGLTGGRVAIITAIVAALGTLLTAIVQSLPQLLEKIRRK